MCQAVWGGEAVTARQDPAAPLRRAGRIPRLQTWWQPCVGGPWQPPQSRDNLSYRRGVSKRESGSYGGQAAERTCCTHGSSQHFSQGIKTCLTGPCVGTRGLLGIAQQSNFPAASPLQGQQQERDKPAGAILLGPSHWGQNPGLSQVLGPPSSLLRVRPCK